MKRSKTISRLTRYVSSTTLHHNVACVNRVSFKISSFCHANGVVIPNRQEVVTWAKVAKIYCPAVASSGLNNPRLSRASRSQLNKNTFSKSLERDVVVRVAGHCTSGHTKKKQSRNQIFIHGHPPSFCHSGLSLPSAEIRSSLLGLPQQTSLSVRAKRLTLQC